VSGLKKTTSRVRNTWTFFAKVNLCVYPICFQRGHSTRWPVGRMRQSFALLASSRCLCCKVWDLNQREHFLLATLTIFLPTLLQLILQTGNFLSLLLRRWAVRTRWRNGLRRNHEKCRCKKLRTQRTAFFSLAYSSCARMRSRIM